LLWIPSRNAVHEEPTEETEINIKQQDKLLISCCMKGLLYMQVLKDFNLKDIIISEEFKRTPPRPEKLERMERRYRATGTLPNNIIINNDNVLIDGYVTYLYALSIGMQQMDIYRGYIECIDGVHQRNANKPFRWRVPLKLYGTIKEGDYALVRTARGVQRVKITNVVHLQRIEEDTRYKYVLSRSKDRKGR
jgi:hypothetical protein